MKKKKILHVLQSDTYSGAENVVCQIIEMFDEKSEFEMSYCSKSGPISEVLQNKNIDYYPVSSLSVKQLKKVIKKYNPDLIHAHDSTATLVSLISTFNKIPIISHLHSNPPWMANYTVKSIAYLLTSFKVHKILTVSDSIIEEFIFGKSVKSKEIKISNPVDLSKIRSVLVAREDLVGKKKEYDVVFVGRLTTAKNPLRFIDLIAELQQKYPQISAAMVGDGDMMNVCKKYIQDRKLEDNIDLKGFVPNPYPIIHESKVLCMTSEWEGYGLVAVEALSLGVPVICPPVGGLKELIDDTCGKLCVKNNQFINAIDKLITDDNYWAEKANGALCRAELLDNKDTFIAELVNVYYEAVK